MSGLSNQLAEARARQALRAAGLAFDGPLERASSTNNEIHLSDHHVIRVSPTVNHRLQREAQLYRHLPTAPWSPVLIASGSFSGTDYLVVERKPGRPLAHVWAFLPAGDRRRAVADLAACLRAIHATPAPGDDVAPLGDTIHLLDPGPGSVVGPLLEGIDRLAADPNADSGVMAAARDYVAANAHRLDEFDERFLVHGDLTFENILHAEGHVSAVVDFEWCRGAPPDLDLDVLLRCCAMPQAHVAAEFESLNQPERFVDVPAWLAEDYPELFDCAGLKERLTIYSLAFDVRDAVTRSVPQHRADVDDLHPYNRLISTVSTGGHVSLLLDRAGLVV